ncbi:MAG: hypothetical protein CML40_06930 [Rhodobacteraceae bacterium]|nr:MAG: hypothetical protein CML40_06930 [Paracoccaceae bacterium]|tara:strand:+ start:43 stop:969 length:927 start_codon:yes stop_codon:yes gene_type:complete
MQIITSPKSNYPVLAGGDLDFATTADGRRVRFALWSKGSKGLVVFFNGRNEYLEKYNETYKRFQDLEFAVVALDWRGQGLSERERKLEHLGYVNNFAEYQLDLEAVLNQAQVQKIIGPRILVGHSTGGCIGLRTLTDNKFQFESAIFLAPLWGGNTMQHLSHRISRLMVLAGWDKKSPISPKSRPYILTTTPEKNCHTSDQRQFERLQKIIIADPRLSAGPATFGWISAVGDELIDLEKRAPIKIPHLVLLGQEDTLISHKAVKKKCNLNDNCELHIIPKARHELLIEKQNIIDSVWEKINNFLIIKQ